LIIPITKPSKPIQISKNIPTRFEPCDHVLVTGTYNKLLFMEKNLTDWQLWEKTSDQTNRQTRL